MKIEDLYILADKEIYTSCVCKIDEIYYDEAYLSGLNVVILIVRENSIDIHSVGKKKANDGIGRLIETISFNSINNVELSIHRGADAAIRSDRPLAHYIFESRIKINLNDNKCLKFKNQSIAVLRLLNDLLSSKHCEVSDRYNHLELVEITLSPKEQYEKLVDNASIFDKKDNDM